MKKIILLLLCTSVLGFSSENEGIIAFTKDGKQIILNEDSTWQEASITNFAELSAAEILNIFMNSTNIEEKIKCVLNSEKITSLIHKYYAGKGKVFSEIEIINPNAKPSENGLYKLFANVAFKDKELRKLGNVLNTYYLKTTTAGIKIDWESTVGYNSMSPEIFIETQPENAVEFRVKAKLITGQPHKRLLNAVDKKCSKLYKFAKDAWCISINNSVNATIGWGFIDKKSAAGEKLFETLKDNLEHKMILKIKSKSKPVIIAQARGVICEIEDILAYDTWYLEDNNN